MSEKLFILKSFRQFLSYRPGRLLLLFLITLLQGLTQGVTLVLLVPLLGLLIPNAWSDHLPGWIVALHPYPLLRRMRDTPFPIRIR